jgi:predicted ester cyclase
MCAVDDLAVIHRYWERVWNAHDLDALDETHHPWFAQNGDPIGRVGFRQSLNGFFESFPDARVSVEEMLGLGQRILVRVAYHGTHEGTYEGLKATGRRFRVTGLELFLVVDGRIAHHWHEMDHLAILRALGAVVVMPGAV